MFCVGTIGIWFSEQDNYCVILTCFRCQYLFDVLTYLIFVQKYRLHTRRPTPTVQSSSSSTSSPPATQFVLVGGILVSPPDYAAAAPGNGACAPPDSIYAPLASVPSDSKLRNQQLHQQSRRSIARPSDTEDRSGGEDDNSMRDDGDATNTASPTTSATSQTTTASPLFWLHHDFDCILCLGLFVRRAWRQLYTWSRFSIAGEL